MVKYILIKLFHSYLNYFLLIEINILLYFALEKPYFNLIYILRLIKVSQISTHLILLRQKPKKPLLTPENPPAITNILKLF